MAERCSTRLQHTCAYKMFSKITDTLVLLSLGNIQMCPGGEQRLNHLDVKALWISQRLLQLRPLSSRERPVRRLQLPCETLMVQ